MTKTKIISLVDGSSYSKSVCGLSAWAAGRLEASVEILHVLGRREASGSDDLSGAIALGARTTLLEKLTALDAERGKLLQERGRAILEDARAVVTAAGVEAVETRLFHGDLIDILARREPEADLLVIGKRGEGADFASLHLGSNLERIVRASHKPVLVASRAFKPIAKVLIAWDGGSSSAKAVDHVARSPLFAGLDIRLVFVGHETDEIRRGMARAAETLGAGGHSVATAVLAGQPEKVLGEHVGAESTDLVVMGAYGHSRIRSLIIGSTTTEMIRSCLVPILLMR
ncbi:universal stress protein [Pseudohoeflea coraliihabitans]|uniref:Universal stress protein n=1 Tax=Pseudohoeflea coraliihabitans TaxID=2860393 RepID=A0ABS6WR92_9HYPH|nr:universal stress protein [Pseudohoeflea sp. DP4N28-3]MBW3098476.1 universal stress protein [Pseudohoeflea sp. DP4N28-3]